MFDWLTEKFELARGGSAHNVRPMEGMRGFAVLLVFFVHYATQIEPWLADHVLASTLVGWLHTMGNTGVDLFFVLSGFLIYGSLISRAQPFAGFMWRRIERIYPAFTALFLIYIALSVVFPAESKIPASTADGAIYLLQNYLLLPGLFPIDPMITVAWSLSYEMFYYLAVPLVIALFKLRERSPLWRSCFFIAMCLSLAIYVTLAGGPIKLMMFLGGMLLYEALEHSTLSVSSATGLVALIAGLLSTVLPVPGPAAGAVKTVILLVAFLLLCLACFRMPQEWLPQAFAWTPLRWLGNMSFSYYLLHGLVLKAVFLVLPIVWPPTGDQPMLFWWLLPPLLALTIVPAALFFLLVERPCSLAPRRVRGARPLPQAASASESGS